MARRPDWLPKMIIGVLGLLALLLAVVTAAVAWAWWMPATEVAPDLLVYEHRGGNSTVLYTDDGIMVVDTKFWRFGERLAARIASHSDKPIKYIVNTHYHWDHARGNVAFPTEAERIVTARTLPLFRKLDGEFWTPSMLAKLPKTGFEEKDHQVWLGGQLIHVVQVGPGHTGGDCVVYFPVQRAVATGDLFFNGYFPVLDHAAGGSFQEWIDTLDRVLALGPRVVIPGHGPVTEAAELKAFQGYLRDLMKEVGRLRTLGWSRDRVVKELRLPVHEARMKNIPGLSSLARNAGEAYDELGRQLRRSVGDVEAIEGEPGEGENNP